MFHDSKDIEGRLETDGCLLILERATDLLLGKTHAQRDEKKVIEMNTMIMKMSWISQLWCPIYTPSTNMINPFDMFQYSESTLHQP